MTEQQGFEERKTLEQLLAGGDGDGADRAPWLVNLQARKVVQASEVQERAIPQVLAGRDVLVQSQTGSGKTYAYLLPVLQRLQGDLRQPQAAVIVPTRELAMQVYRELQMLIEGSALQAVALAGGADLLRQVDKLKQHPQIVVGTPGRLVELIKKRKLRMHDVRTIVIDEADQLMWQGFQADIEQVLKSTMRDRQLLLFSATLGKEVRTFADGWMRDPVMVEVLAASKTVSQLQQFVVYVDERDKIDVVRRLTHALAPKAVLLFVNDKDEIGEVVAKLQYATLSAAAIYADQGKQERADVMRRFREGKLLLLVATDVAARGLDFPDVELVINYDLPDTEEHYVHRVGRTARMGRSGTAVSLATTYQKKMVEKYGRRLGAAIEERVLARGQLFAKKRSDK